MTKKYVAQPRLHQICHSWHKIFLKQNCKLLRRVGEKGGGGGRGNGEKKKEEKKWVVKKLLLFWLGRRCFPPYLGGHFILDDSVINQGNVRDTATTQGRQVLSSYSRLHTSHHSILKGQTVNDTEDNKMEGGGLLSSTLGSLLLLLTQFINRNKLIQPRHSKTPLRTVSTSGWDTGSGKCRGDFIHRTSSWVRGRSHIMSATEREGGVSQFLIFSDKGGRGGWGISV